MAIIKSVVDFFRNSKESQKIEKYDILSSLIATSEYIDATRKLYSKIVLNPKIAVLTGKLEARTSHEQKAQEAYKAFVGGLPAYERSKETSHPFSSITTSINYIGANVELIEDNFDELFDSLLADENAIRTSTFIVLGYLETANEYMTWLSYLSAHALDDTDLIPPFWTKTLTTSAKRMGEFVGHNLNRWTPTSKGFLESIKHIQKTGSDVALKTGDNWMDEFIHDTQLTIDQQDLMSASIRNPILWYIDKRVTSHQNKVELLSSRKDWLISKVALEERILSGLDPETAEYKKLKKTCDHYASLVTKYEQKLERMRA